MEKKYKKRVDGKGGPGFGQFSPSSMSMGRQNQSSVDSIKTKLSKKAFGGAIAGAGDKKAFKAPSGGMSTQAAGKLTPSLRSSLQKDAPETLSRPSRGSFADDNSYQGALAKYKKFGNWASSK